MGVYFYHFYHFLSILLLPLLIFWFRFPTWHLALLFCSHFCAQNYYQYFSIHNIYCSTKSWNKKIYEFRSETVENLHLQIHQFVLNSVTYLFILSYCGACSMNMHMFRMADGVWLGSRPALRRGFQISLTNMTSLCTKENIMSLIHMTTSHWNNLYYLFIKTLMPLNV